MRHDDWADRQEARRRRQLDRMVRREERRHGRHRSGLTASLSAAAELLGKEPGQSWSDYLGLRGGYSPGYGPQSRRPSPTGAPSSPPPAGGGAFPTGAFGGTPYPGSASAPKGAAPNDPSPNVPPDGFRSSRPGAPPPREEQDMARLDPIYQSPNPHRLYRNTQDAKIGGVCAGIADYFNIDSWIVRLIFLLAFFSGVGSGIIFIAYFVMWWLVKPRPRHLFENQEEEKFWRSVATRPDQTLSSLRTKFRDLDQQISGLESFVASREYDLHRQFRDLERK